MHRVISCHPDLYTKPRDPRLSTQSSVTLDSDDTEDMSVGESSSTTASVDTAEGHNTADETDGGTIEKLNSANAKEDWAVIYTGNAIKTVCNVVSTESKIQPQHTHTQQTGVVLVDVQASDDAQSQEGSVDNKTVVTSSRQMSNKEKTGKVDVTKGQESEGADGRALDLNSNQNDLRGVRNLNDNVKDAERSTDVNRNLDENYNVHTQKNSTF